ARMEHSSQIPNCIWHFSHIGVASYRPIVAEVARQIQNRCCVAALWGTPCRARDPAWLPVEPASRCLESRFRSSNDGQTAMTHLSPMAADPQTRHHNLDGFVVHTLRNQIAINRMFNFSGTVGWKL